MSTPRRKVRSGLRFDTLEGRIALSTAAHPVQPAAEVHAARSHSPQQVHEAAPKAQDAPKAVLVKLTPGVTGIKVTGVTYDDRIHLITVKGTVDIGPQGNPPAFGVPPSYPSQAYIGVMATQGVNRLHSVTGYSYSQATIPDASSTRVAFTARVLASAGEFGAGTVSLSISYSNPYTFYGNNALGVVARMRNAKAY